MKPPVLRPYQSKNRPFGTSRRSRRTPAAIRRSRRLTIESLEDRTLLSGWGPTDFLVADQGAGRIAVFGDDWVFKDYVDADFPGVSGLDFLPNGNLVAASSTTQEVRIYEPVDGNLIGGFTDPAVGMPGDVKSSPDGRIYVATGIAEDGISEFDADGSLLRAIGAGVGYTGTAVVSGTELLAGAIDVFGAIHVFDLASGDFSRTIVLTGGPLSAERMRLAEDGNSVLITDPFTSSVYELDTDGNLVQAFPTLQTGLSLPGVTPGPMGTVLATGFRDFPAVLKWDADGNLVGVTDISANVLFPGNIVWAGVGGTVVNNPPTAVDDAYSTDEDTVLMVAAPGVLANDSDPDGDPLSVTAFDLVSDGGATVSGNPDGSFTYDPTASGLLNSLRQGETFIDSFNYTVGDGQGGFSTGTVNVTVTGVNDAPSANDDAGFTTDEDTPLNGSGLLANDFDPDSGDTLTVVPGTAMSTLGAAVTLNADGTFTYDPTGSVALNALQVGQFITDTFTYTARDDFGAEDQATVTITVNGLNDPPIAVGDSFSTDEDTELIVAPPGVLANDSDPDTADALTAEVVSPPGFGTLVLNPDGSFRYVPSPDFNGTDRFFYRAVDTSGTPSDTAEVIITVAPVNDPPEAVSDAYSTDEDTTLMVAAPGVLGNDTDVDGDPLTSELVSAPASGTLTFNSDGSFQYVPNPNFNGSDSFTYKANDGTADSNVATVTITVNPVNNTPTAVASPGGGPYTVDEGGAVGLDGSNSFDVDGTIVMYAWDFDGDGQFDDATGPNPTFNASGLDGPSQVTVRLRVTDDGGATDEDFALVNVENVDPTADAGGPYSVLQGGTVMLDGSGSFDPAGAADPLTYEWDFNGDGIVDATGPVVTFDAGGLQAGDTVNGKLTVRDDDGGVSEDPFSITVTEAVVGVDFGDALGTGYPTRLREDGARHDATGPTLGLVRDTEPDGQPNADATGDDANPAEGPDDEDGLVRHLIGGCGGFVELQVSGVTAPAFIHAWIDFDNNGVWDDPEEQITDPQSGFRVEEDGLYRIGFTLPEGAVQGSTFARFRLSTTGGLGLFGLALDGEVEDHVVQIGMAPSTVFVDDDFVGKELGEDPDGDGPATAFGFDAFATIQKGIDCVSAGGLVNVTDGTYPENVLVHKTVTIQGAGIPSTLVQPPGGGGDGITIAAGNVQISDLSVSNHQNGIVASGVDAPTLIRVESRDNTFNGFRGDDLSGTLRIEEGNYSGNGLRGIQLDKTNVVELTDVVAAGNHEFNFATLAPSASVKFVRGNFSFATGSDGGGIFVTQAGSVDLIDVTAIGNPQGNVLLTINDAVTIQGGMYNSGSLGIHIVEADAVKLTDVTADSNETANLFVQRSESVTIEGGSFSTSRREQGIKISNVDTLAVTDVTANTTHDQSLLVEDARSIAIEGGSFTTLFGSAEAGGAIEVRRSGALTLKNVRANASFGSNLFVEETDSATIDGGQYNNSEFGFGAFFSKTNRLNVFRASFTGNAGYGILISKAGESIKLTDAQVKKNGFAGLRALGTRGTTQVTIVRGSYSGNGFDGINLLSVGDVNLTGVRANDNTGGSGLIVTAQVGQVSVNGGSFSGNTGDGIRLAAVGTVRVDNVVARKNSSDGLSVQNFTVGSASGRYIGNRQCGIRADSFLPFVGLSTGDAVVILNREGNFCDFDETSSAGSQTSALAASSRQLLAGLQAVAPLESGANGFGLGARAAGAPPPASPAGGGMPTLAHVWHTWDKPTVAASHPTDAFFDSLGQTPPDDDVLALPTVLAPRLAGTSLKEDVDRVRTDGQQHLSDDLLDAVFAEDLAALLKSPLEQARR